MSLPWGNDAWRAYKHQETHSAPHPPPCHHPDSRCRRFHRARLVARRHHARQTARSRRRASRLPRSSLPKRSMRPAAQDPVEEKGKAGGPAASLGMDSAVECAEPFIFVARGEPADTRRRQAGIGGENAARHLQSPRRWRIAVEIFVQAGDAAARTIACRSAAMAAATRRFALTG